MSEETANAASAAANTEAEVTGSEQLESTTPEEVASVLKGSGINLPAEPKAEESDNTDEEDTNSESETDASGADESTDTATEATAGEADEEAEDPETNKPVEAATDAVAPEFSLDVIDADGVTHKIEKIEDLPEDFTPKNNRQIIQIIKDLGDLEDKKAEHEADETKKAQEAETAKTVETTLKGWEEERKELNITEDERYDKVMQYMAEENDKRQEKGRPLIRTVEHALLGLEKQEAKQAEADKAKAAKDTARKNGGLVGGSSAPASSGAPVYKAGSARNVGEAIRAAGLL